MNYTQFRYGKRVANPDVQWIVEGLKPNGTKSLKNLKANGTLDYFINHVLQIIQEIGFIEKSYNKRYVGDVCLSLYFYDEYIEFILSKGEDKCVIKVEEFKSTNPKLTETWEKTKNTKNLSDSYSYLNQDCQYRFIDTLIHNTRTLWEIK